MKTEIFKSRQAATDYMGNELRHGRNAYMVEIDGMYKVVSWEHCKKMCNK